MSTVEPPTKAGHYNDATNEAIIVILISFSSFVVLVNLFAVISIARHSSVSMISVLVCYLSSIELLHAIACGAITAYTYYNARYAFEESTMMCGFYAWFYLVFRIMATLVVSLLTFDRVVLSCRPTFYVRTWGTRATRWVLAAFVFVLSLVLTCVPWAASSFVPSPDAGRFHCLFPYDGSFSAFYVAFHLVQTLATVVSLPWVFAREKRVDARLSVLLVGEMVVCRKGRNVLKVRDGLRISRLVASVVGVYHACSGLLPLLILLRFLNIDYPPVVGLFAIQLPTFAALSLPLIYAFTWKPYRRAYYNSLACLCLSSQQVRPRTVRSIHNPAFRETQDFDANSILHARGIAPHQANEADESTIPTDSTRSEPLVLDPRHLTSGPTTTASDSAPRPTPELLPRTTSFQERHFIVPSKFQNIFEIIDALSAPHRHAVDDSSDSLSNGRAPAHELDSVSSLGAASPVKLRDVSFDLPGIHGNSFDGVDFSSIDISTTPYNRKKVNKVKLDSERNSFKDLHLDERFRKHSDERSTLSGPIRFTDLRKVRAEEKNENLRNDSEMEYPERFARYLASESYLNRKV